MRPRSNDPTPADQFEAYIREVEAREAAQPRRPTGPRSTWPQRAIALAVGLALWAVILAGLSRAVVGWP
ncbi:hypothetical protein BHAOGJBA_4284 [Methylobacterium hispanicum]|uniref:Uncharacterized protein n=1 Tax=Methylobacterium hispanicum TaxID=270350 RepID=A0AAV4ZQJ8_9HYPH|nr:hypothetical protein [Methylobacterium hispanicum]GJD90742.1 hypothetical protein BHAOGJBA_4284 [Methylobacterium hispanicum]